MMLSVLLSLSIHLYAANHVTENQTENQENQPENKNDASFKANTVTAYKSPTWSGIFSTVIPGSGHMYQGAWGKGFLFLGSEASLVTGVVIGVNQDTRQGDMLAVNLYYLAQNEHFYNAYSSYQDARLAMSNQGYLSEISKDSLWDLFTSPFDTELLQRWTFLVPTLTIAGLELLVALADDQKYRVSSGATWAVPLLAGQSDGIGVGEEAFFRGYLQPEFKEMWGRKWPAIFTQAALFGWLHYRGDVAGVPQWETWVRPVFAGLKGVYYGWLVERNQFSLRENIAAHAWWDFIIFSSEYLRHRKVSGFILSVDVPLF